MQKNDDCGCGNSKHDDYYSGWPIELPHTCEISTIPCNDYYLFNAHPFFIGKPESSKCSEIHPCSCDKRLSEFLHPVSCKRSRHVGNVNPLELQLARNPVCSSKCCLRSYPHYIEAACRAKSACHDPCQHPYTNGRTKGQSVSKSSCLCSDDYSPALTAPVRKEYRDAKCPRRRRPIEMLGDTTMSGYTQQRAFGAIALVNNNTLSKHGCCSTGTSSYESVAPSRPNIPVSAHFCNDLEVDQECPPDATALRTPLC